MHPDALSRLKASYSNGQLWTNHVKQRHVDPVSPEYICDLLFAALEIPGDDQAAIIDQLFSRRGPLVVPKRTSDALKRLGKELNRSAQIAAYLVTHYRRNFEQEVALLQAERFKENRDRAIEVQLPTGPEGALEKRVLLFHDKYGNQVHQQAMADYICRWVEKEYPLLSSADKAADSQMIRGANGNAIAARLRQLSSKHAHDRSEQELVAKWKLVGIDAECFLATPSNQKPAHRVLSAIFHPKSELIGAYRADGNIFWERLSVRYKGTDLNIPRQTSLAQVIKEMLKFPPEGREEAWIKERQQSLLAQLEQAIQTLVNNGSPEPSVDTLQRALKAGSGKRSSFEQFISRVRCLSSRQKEFEHLAEIARKFHARGTFVSRFRHARKLKRHFIFRLGPTNSGKTHAALQAMAKARSGVYLAPLRLLALEKQEELLSMGICTSLVTGEERDLRKGTHICQTIEMLDIRTPYEVAVIDEAQMLRDPDRGWAWTNAICGVVAPTIYVTGAEYIQNMLIGLVESCGDTWETIKTERNGSLTLTSPSEWPKISPNSAIAAFGRQTVLDIKATLEQNGYKVSAIYGALSPEVRREQAKAFREGRTDIVVATDAIGMGLNLPVETLYFWDTRKFDGHQRRPLETIEVLQIGGRAGRGIGGQGFIGCFSQRDYEFIRGHLGKTIRNRCAKFQAAPTIAHVRFLAEELQTDSITTILGFFAAHLEQKGSEFTPMVSDDTMDLAWIIDGHCENLSPAAKYTWACSPAGNPFEEKNEDLTRAFISWLQAFDQGIPCHLDIDHEDLRKIRPGELRPNDHDRVLESLEKQHKVATLYRWLYWRYRSAFPDYAAAEARLRQLNDLINKLLAKKRGGAPIVREYCDACGDLLMTGSRYSICTPCHKSGYRRRNPEPGRYDETSDWEDEDDE